MKQVWQAFLDSKKERRRTEATAEPALPPAETPPTASFDLWGRVFPMLKREEIALKVAPVYEETGLGVFPYLDCLVASNIGWKGWRGWIGQAGQLTGLVLSSRVASLAAAAAALVFAPQHVAVLIPPIIVANALISVSLHDNKTFRQFLARLAAELLFNFAAFSGPVALFAWMPEGPLFQNAIALFLLTLASLALAIMTHWAWNKFKLLGVSAVMGDAGDPARVIEDPLGSPLGLSSVVTESGLRPDQEAVWNAIWDDKDFCQALREARATRHLEPFRETLRFILEKGGGRAWLPLLARARFVSAPRIVQKKICSFNARNRQRVFGFGFWNQDVPVIVIVERWRLLQTMILVLMAIGRASPKECLRLIERSRYLFDVASCYAGPRSPMLAKSYKACEEIMALDRAYRRRGKKYELYAYGLLQKHSRWTTVLAELAFASSRQTLKFPSGRPSEKLPRIEKRFLNVVNCRGPCRLIWDQGIWIVYRPEMAPRDVWEGAKWKKILKENARKRGVRPVLERCRQWHIRKRRERRLNVANAQQWASLYPILVQMAQKPIPKGHEAAVRFLQEQGAVTLNNHWAIVISQRWCLPTLFYKSLVVHEAERRGQRNDYFVHYHPFARSLRLSAGDMHHVDCEQAAFHEVRGQSEGRLVGSSLGSRRQEQRSLCQKLIEFGPYMDEGLLERLRKEGGLDWKKLHNLSQLFQECCSLYEKIMKSAGAEKMWQEKGEVFWRRFFRVARLRGTGRGERPTPEKLWGQIMKALPKAIERVVDIVYGFQEEGADLVAGKRLSRRFARLVMLLRAARELSDQEVPALRQGPPQRASVLLASGPQSDDVPPRPGLHAQDRDVACSKIDYLLPAPGVNAPASPSLWLGGRGLASKADGPPAVDARAAGAGRGDEHIVANEGENEVRGQVK